MTLLLRFVVVVAAAVLAGCAGRQAAPVIERSPVAKAPPAPVRPATPVARVVEPRAETYVVQRGDTLYGIALDHGLDYRELAEWNRISNPNLIRVGEVLRLTPPKPAPAAPVVAETAVQVRPVTVVGPVESRPLGTEPQPQARKIEEAAPAAARKPDEVTIARLEPRRPEPKPEAKPEPRVEAKVDARPAPAADADDEEQVQWGWPAAGRILARFAEPGNKGIDIAGRRGDPVIAAAPGRVVYSGAGLRGYGKLIIIKHNQTYLSAYAHNDQILVKEGQNVTRGQKIGEIGSTDTDSPKLHFEIRRLGKPVDPLKFLPERPS